VPEWGELGKLKKQPDGRLKGTLEYSFDRSTKLKIAKTTVEEIPQERLTQWDIEVGNTHRVFYTKHSKEEDRQYYSEKGGNDYPQSQESDVPQSQGSDAPPQRHDDRQIPF